MWSPRANGPGISDLEVHVESLSTKAHDVQGERTVLDVEWESLLEHSRDMSSDPAHVTTVGELVENKEKNRYPDVLPNDKTRVKLRACPTHPSDYINASFIDGKAFCLPHHNYICAQAPKDNTVEDFWRVIWENDVRLIIMLTQEVERSRKVKCAKYWPESPTEVDKDPVLLAGDVLVRWQFVDGRTVLKEERKGDLLIKHFTIFCFGQKRDVTHIQHVAWPDHGVPDGDSLGLAHLLRISDEYIRSVLHAEDGRVTDIVDDTDDELYERTASQSCVLAAMPPPSSAEIHAVRRRKKRYAARPVDKDCLEDFFHGNTTVPPILVHCSAGIGRTGCFITVHVLLALFKQSYYMHMLGARGKIPRPFKFNFDVLGAIKTLRMQRAGMVQSLDQLRYIYHTLLQEYKYLKTGGFTDERSSPHAAAATPLLSAREGSAGSNGSRRSAGVGVGGERQATPPMPHAQGSTCPTSQCHPVLSPSPPNSGLTPILPPLCTAATTAGNFQARPATGTLPA